MEEFRHEEFHRPVAVETVEWMALAAVSGVIGNATYDVPKGQLHKLIRVRRGNPLDDADREVLAKLAVERVALSLQGTSDV